MAFCGLLISALLNLSTSKTNVYSGGPRWRWGLGGAGVLLQSNLRKLKNEVILDKADGLVSLTTF